MGSRPADLAIARATPNARSGMFVACVSRQVSPRSSPFLPKGPLENVVLGNLAPACFLYAIQLPPAGGDTWFMNMYSAYEALPEATKKRIASLKIKHDASHTSAGTLRKGFTKTDGVAPPEDRANGALSRPAAARVRRGIARRTERGTAGRALGYAIQPQFTVRHQWRLGDVLMWDNRCTMHRRDPFDPASRRILHRTQVNQSGLI